MPSALFRIDSLSDALLYARCVVFDFKPNRFYEELLSVADPVLIAIIAVGGLLLFVIDLIHEKGKHISELLPENEHLRHIVYASILLIIFFMYMYHFGEDASGFIYTRF